MRRLFYKADGLDMVGAYFAPANANGPAPGVLVFPQAFGLGDHALERARRLAADGYAAFACDLHGGAEYIADLVSVRGRLAALRSEPDRIVERASGALDLLAGMPEVDQARIGAVGFCFGGTMALELARSGAALLAVVGFHCDLATRDATRAHQIRSRVLVCVGSDDPIISVEQRIAFEREMATGNVDWQMLVQGGAVHSFTDPAADNRGNPTMFRYDAKADARSSMAMYQLLQEVLSL